MYKIIQATAYSCKNDRCLSVQLHLKVNKPRLESGNKENRAVKGPMRCFVQKCLDISECQSWQTLTHNLKQSHLQDYYIALTFEGVQVYLWR